MVLRVLVVLGASLGLHLTLGGGWTLLAGVVAGLWQGRGGWWLGGLGVGLGWLALVAYNYAVAPGAVGTMTQVLGSLLGNLPGGAVVGLTLLTGCVLGALGGGTGTTVARLLGRAPAQRNSVARTS